MAAYLDCSDGSSSPFKTQAAETRRTRRNILENFRKAYGDPSFIPQEANGSRVMLLTREHMQKIVNEKSSTPFAQRNFLNTFRAMFEWAVGEGRLPDNPALGGQAPKVKTAGYKTWSEAEIERFEAKHPIGTKARLAFGLLLFTGQRRGDVVKMGPQHDHDGVLSIVQEKTGTPVVIPLHPKLREIIDATPSGHLSFLVTHFGKPYTAPGFGNWFRELANEAGCPDVSAHGLRKATATRLADMDAASTKSQASSVTRR